MSTDTTESNASAQELEDLENRLDSALLKLARMEQANEESFPAHLVRRLSDGENPLRVWREYRGLSHAELARAAGAPTELVLEIEGGREDVPLRIMNELACALRVDLDDLVPWPGDAEGKVQAGE